MKALLPFCLLLATQALFAEESDVLPDRVRRQLLTAARKWEVTQPDEDAKVVKVFVFRSVSADGSQKKDFHLLGFVSDQHPNQLLIGGSWRKVAYSKPILVENLEKLSLDEIASTTPFGQMVGVNSAS